MRVGLFVAALAGVACGDNALPVGAPLVPAGALTIVAHPDDELLFMQPDVFDVVQGGRGLTSVYVTAGNGDRGLGRSEARYDGLMAAYGAIAGARDWRCGWIEIAGHAAEHCRLEAARVSLVFLGYPDGKIDGSAPESLQRLWQGDIAQATTVGRRTATYDRDGLIATVAAIVVATAPTVLRTLDAAASHGRDHSDHTLAGALAVLAIAATDNHPAMVAYRGYNLEDEPAGTVLYDRSLDVLARYHACADRCAPCGQACEADKIRAGERAWLQRRAAIGLDRVGEGRLRIGDSCAAVTSAGGNATLVDCASAPSWQIDGGALRSGGLCLTTNFVGEIVGASCGGLGPGGRFFLDDEGHLWSGVASQPAGGAAMAHLFCVGNSGGRPRARPCGGDGVPSWELARPMVATPRAVVGIARSGRAVRMGRLAGAASLCAIEAGGLMCAAVAADGSVGAAVRLDDAAAPLVIVPDSLVIGDVDGDGVADACGRDAGGVSCAMANGGYRGERWTSALAVGSGGADLATSRSLAIASEGEAAEICGLAEPGVVCVARGAAVVGDVRSAWPDRSAALWIGSLDGDGQIDWCAATPGGPACGLGRDRELTRDGAPWGYARAGQVEGSAAGGGLDVATAVMSDVDGDGRDDLCSVQGEVIACARSTGRGFGPRTAVARLPAGMVATSLWAADARLCAADAVAIACTR